MEETVVENVVGIVDRHLKGFLTAGFHGIVQAELESKVRIALSYSLRLMSRVSIAKDDFYPGY